MNALLSSNTTDSTEDLLFAIQQKNLVYNYNFLYYSNQVIGNPTVFNHPDGWLYSDNGNDGQIGFDNQSNACVINKSNGDSLMTFGQNISEFPRWEEQLQGQRVSATAVIYNPGIQFEVTFSLFDGVNTSSKSVVFNNKETKEINLTQEVNENATKLNVSLTCTTSQAVINIKKVFVNKGAIALDTLPCMVEGIIGERRQYMSTEIPPAEELSLCTKSQELSNSQTRLSSFLNGKFGTGSNKLSLLPDMRGYFSRAWDNGASTDPDASSRTPLGDGSVDGDHTGTVQEDQFKSHQHDLNFNTNGQITAGTAATMTIISLVSGSQTQVEGGAESRGKNISELYTMKWA